MTMQPWNMTNVKAAPQMVAAPTVYALHCKCVDASRSSHAAATGSTWRVVSFTMLMYNAMRHNLQNARVNPCG